MSGMNKSKSAAYQKAWASKNPERVKEIARASYLKNREARMEGMLLAYHSRTRAERKEERKRYYAKHRDRILEMRKNERLAPEYKQQRKRCSLMQTRKLRDQIIEAYGGKCACCEEDRFEFLTIDHINGRGKEEHLQFGSNTYRMLRRLGFPKDKYRLLCMNCNFAIGKFGYCPHQYELAVCA